MTTLLTESEQELVKTKRLDDAVKALMARTHASFSAASLEVRRYDRVIRWGIFLEELTDTLVDHFQRFQFVNVEEVQFAKEIAKTVLAASIQDPPENF